MRGPISVKPFARKWRASNWVLISLHSNILTLAPIRCFIIIVCLERTTKNSASQFTGGYLSSFPKERKSHENFLQFTRPEKLRALARLFRCSFRKWQEEAWRDATRLATRSHCFCCLIIAQWFLISPGYHQEIMGRHYDKMTCCTFRVLFHVNMIKKNKGLSFCKTNTENSLVFTVSRLLVMISHVCGISVKKNGSPEMNYLRLYLLDIMHPS